MSAELTTRIPLEGATHERGARSLAARVAAIEGVLFARASASGRRIHIELEPGAPRDRIAGTPRTLGVADPSGASGGQSVADSSRGGRGFEEPQAQPTPSVDHSHSF